MKQILVILAIGLCIISCSACKNIKEENDMIKFESGIFYDKNWDETVGTYSCEAIIPDKETALKVAKAVFDGMKKNEELQEYVPQYVFYDNQDEIWIVSFGKASNQNTLGEDCNIAIQKKDGKVLRIWFGE